MHVSLGADEFLPRFLMRFWIAEGRQREGSQDQDLGSTVVFLPLIVASPKVRFFAPSSLVVSRQDPGSHEMRRTALCYQDCARSRGGQQV